MDSRGTRELTATRPGFTSLRTPKMSTITTESDYLTDAGIADLFHVSVRTLQRWVKDSDFPKPLQLGRCRRWDRADVLAYLRRRAAAAKPSLDDERAE